MISVLRAFMEKLQQYSEEEINAVIEHTEVETFRKGEFVSREGKISDKCYFVLQGCVRQYLIIDGEEKTTGFFLEGQPVVLYSSYLKKTPSDFYISCVEDTVLLSGTRLQEQEMLRKYPKLESLTHAMMLHDYDKAENYISLLNGYKPEERYLLLLKNQPELLNRAPLHQIASFLGITPESFSRIRKRILVTDKIRQQS